LARLEFALSAVAGLGLSIDEMARTVQAVHAFVHGFIRDELADRQWRASQTAAAASTRQLGLAAYLQHVIKSWNPGAGAADDAGGQYRTDAIDIG
jgi:hypothetical protein